MGNSKKPDSETGLPVKSRSASYRDIYELHGRNFDGSWHGKRAGRNLDGSWNPRTREDVQAESGETFDKEIASAERMKRGYFKNGRTDNLL